MAINTQDHSRPYVIAMSDLHVSLPDLSEVDHDNRILIIARRSKQSSLGATFEVLINIQRDWLREEFFPWIQTLSFEMIIATGGNHDFYFEENYHTYDQAFCPANSPLKPAKLHVLLDEWRYCQMTKA